MLVYITLTSVGSNGAFANGPELKIEKQNEARFTSSLNPANLTIQPIAGEFLIGQLNTDQSTDKGYYHTFIGIPITQAIPFNSVSLFIDFQAIECAFAGLDHVFPFHYFW